MGTLGAGLCALAMACAPNLTTTGGAGGEGGDGSGGAGASGSGSAGGGGGAGGEIVCPEVPNTPTMVPVASASGKYCIDSTEVTNSQYAAWMPSAAGMDTDQGPECAFNMSFVPAITPPNDDHPVAHVDWCDAAAFCKWHGKRLCGKIGGGPVPYADINNAATSQWHNACSGAGTLVYPYGGAYDAVACNGQDKMNGASVKVASLAGCVGGLPGLFDMSGNLSEWEDACDGTAGENDTCRRRGGGYASIATDLDCPTTGGGARGTANATTGFRCCVDVP
ncbi:formylglycine-generating enzyme family protein [Polyangium sorediatum]|uniref:SUMF1/EgtB/PvdO family nonheme iron enzyme n=1 Tax=Polyangium sorediatum TaxID=889274 RepID=A0ABT6NNU4_9BACT|nr:SUMF1/EgtB/PvdO family nonheme iron enzyme [Polyangium sorediatum]MDI1430002.1 SUMF1/EgtB/PvdO family nonheme iron enzyme [Polyangium sorediatum]